MAVKEIPAGAAITPENAKIRTLSSTHKPASWVSPYGQAARKLLRVGTVIGAGMLTDKQGQIIGVIGVGRDITEKKKAEEALKESEEKWRSLTENSPDYIMQLDIDYTIRFINRTVPDLTKEQVIGKSNLDFVPSEYHKLVVECFDGVIQSGKPDRYETKYVTAEGETKYFDVRVSPIKDKDGNITGLINTSNNITERKQAEEKLKSRNRELQTFYDAAVGRELKVIELKKEINELLERSGEKPKYETPV